MIKKLIIISILSGLLLPNFSFAPTPNLVWGFAQPIEPPETLEEAKELGEKVLETGQKELPGILERIWQEEVLPFWQKMWDWFQVHIWQPYIEPPIKKEIEKRKPIIKEEFQKEKEETKESAKTEVVPAFKSLWERFMELIK